MFTRLLSTLSRIAPVHIARTPEERAAVFRMRYRVYVEEQRDLRFPGTNHALREIRQPDDDEPTTTLFYTGTPPDITGTLTVHVLDPRRLPDGFHADYSLDRFQSLDDRPLAHVGFLMTERTLRGTAEVLALTSGAVAHVVKNHQVEIMFSVCAPGLLRSYQRFGLRPYGAAVFSSHRGMQIPVAGVTADLDHVRRCASPWYPTLSKLGAEGRLPRREFASLLPAFGRSGVELDPARVCARVEAAMARHPIPVLASLPEGTRRRLLRGGFIFDVARDLAMMVEGLVNRDVFIILDGRLAVYRGGRLLATLGPGEVIGEIAFFSDSGQRAASVRSRAAGQVLHLSHGFLRRLAAEHPASGVALYQALGRVLAHRLGSDAEAPPESFEAGALPPAPQAGSSP
jgi:hypothetical protein